MVQGVSSYFKSTVDEVKTTLKSNRITNGPEGTIAAKTATALELVEKGSTQISAKQTQTIRSSLKFV